MREYKIVFEGGETETIKADCMTLNQGICFSDSEDHLQDHIYTAIIGAVAGKAIAKITSEPCED